MNWETVIGLEVHVQLATQSKIFSGASTSYGAAPNIQACAIDLGMPGVLPVLNEQAVRMAVKFAVAIGAEIGQDSIFARKNYFYPDLPKGYQISQYEQPIVGKGQLIINLSDGSSKTIGITRAHLEEDAGKSLHEDFHGLTGIDLNRAGTPLLEIVSEPDMRTAEEAVAYLKTLHALVRYLEISDGNMAEGSFRCDANVSVRPRGQEKLGTRCEIKNLNSFRFIERAIHHEVQRHIEILENGGQIKQETRLYDADRDETRTMRSKEEANDYRYFPDPDLLPIHIDAELIDAVRATLPELPAAKQQRFINDFQLSSDVANSLVSSREFADYFENVIHHAPQVKVKTIANWLNGELNAALNRAGITINECPVSSERLAQLLMRIDDGTISAKSAKQVFDILWQEQQSADEIIQSLGLQQMTDSSAIETIIDDIIAKNPTQAAEYRAGKEKMFAFFVGQVMRATQGKANPQQINDMLKNKLS